MTISTLLAHLHRGGTHGYYWTIDGKKTHWWTCADGPLAAPSRRDLYFGIHPTTGIPPTNAHGEAKEPHEVRAQLPYIAAINCVFADFDAKDAVFGGDKEEALAYVKSICAAPSIIIDSGGGYHCYWLLRTPHLIANDAERQIAADLQEAWVRFVGGDKAAKDLVRILRVPGTFNTKYAPHRPVVFVQCDMTLLYELPDLVAMMPSPTPQPRQDIPPRPRQAVPDANPTPVSGWRAIRQRGIVSPETWARQKLATAITMAVTAMDGEKHADLLKAAKLAGGALPYLSESDIETALDAAIAPRAKDRTSALKTIQDGIAYGRSNPLEMPEPPTNEDPKVDSKGCARCPRCDYFLAKSDYDYPGTTTPGWYCPRCKGVMKWPVGAVDATGTAPTAQATGSAESAGTQQPTTTIHWGDDIDQIALPRALIKGYLNVGTVALFIGPSEAGKSTIAVDVACKVAAHYPVIYVAGEDAGNVRTQIRAWELTTRRSRGRLGLRDTPLLLGDADQVDAFINEAAPYIPRLIIFDTLSACIPGADENGSEMTAITHRLNMIADTLGASILVLHHPTKSDNGQYRGHSSLLNNTHTMWVADRDGGDDLVVLKVVRHKGKKADDAALRLIIRATDITDPDEGVLSAPVAVPAGRVMQTESHISTRQRAILIFLRDLEVDGGATTTEIQRVIAAECKASDGRVRTDIAQLAKRGLITVPDKQRDPRVITEKGRSLIKSDQADQADQVISGDPFVVNTKLAVLSGLDRDAITPPATFEPRHDAANLSSTNNLIGLDRDLITPSPIKSNEPDHLIRSFRSDQVIKLGDEKDTTHPTATPDADDLWDAPAFALTNQWQEVPPGFPIPADAEGWEDRAEGLTYYRLAPAPAPTPAPVDEDPIAKLDRLTAENLLKGSSL